MRGPVPRTHKKQSDFKEMYVGSASGDDASGAGRAQPVDAEQRHQAHQA